MKKRFPQFESRNQRVSVSEKSARRVIWLLGGLFLFGIFLPGCASGLFHEGAYVGNGESGDSQARPAAVPTSSVPLFASRDVKNDAKNRVAMERSTGRPVAARPAAVTDVIAWHQAGVPDENIMNHVRIHGLYQPLQSQDVLTLQNHGVSVNVIRTMKEHPYPKVDAPVPPPRSTVSSFTRSSQNPDTNPGNGYYAGSGSSGSEVAAAPARLQPTVAPPVQPSGNGKPRLQSANVAPAYGTCVSGNCIPADGAVLMEGTPCVNGACYVVPDGFILEDGAYVVPGSFCPNCAQ